MLVLTRKPTERIMIQTSDGVIIVGIAQVNGDRVRVGIEVPKSCAVHREEVWLKMQAEADALKTRSNP